MAEKKTFWQRLCWEFLGKGGEPVPPEKFTCPYCSKGLEKNFLQCGMCGVQFKTEWKSGVEVWFSGKPVIQQENNILLLLEEHGISKKRFDGLFSTMPENLTVEPFAFLSTLTTSLNEHIRLFGYGRFEELSLKQVMPFVISKIPQNAKSIGAVRSVIENVCSRERSYSSYLVDCCAGSGWLPSYDYPVILEPFGYIVSSDEKFSSLFHDIRLENVLKNKVVAYTINSDNLCCFNIVLSNKDNITPNQMEHFWSSLQNVSHPIIFEIVGSGKEQKIIFQFLCHPDDKEHIAKQLLPLFPNSSINPEGNDHDYLIGQLGDDYREKIASDFQAFGAVFGLGRHCSYLLRTLTSFDKTDPLSSLISQLSELEKDESVVVQALISPSKYEQLGIIGQQLTTFSHLYKYSRFKDCPIRSKLKYPLFAVCFRVMAFGAKETSRSDKLKSSSSNILSVLAPFSSPEGNCISNKLLDITPSELSMPEAYNQVKSELSERELLSVLERNTYRHGFILNSQELASLCHFPSSALEHPKLLRMDSTTAKAPELATAGDGLLIGINEVFGQSKQVYVPEDFRFRHIYIVGKSGTGKSTLLLNMLKGDIDAGKGIGLIDPHGDLVESVLQVIPEERIDDVILFDPSDYEHPIGFNMLQAGDRLERRQMRSDIVVAIRRLFEGASWGDNIDQLFRVSVATLLDDSTQAHTLLDMRKLISDDVFRSQVITRISDDYLKEFWVDDFPSFSQSTVSAVKRRLGSILNEPEVRNVLAQTRTSFDFKKMMDTRKIFLANLSRGNLGEDISALFGGLLVSKIQLTAMARASQPEAERVPFYLYVDEFQNFVNDSFEIILSEARKYKLCLCIAHQFTGQLPSRLYDAVFGNVGTLISFEVGVDDATALEKQLGKFTKDDIINLERFHTFTRIGKARDSFSMRTIPPPEIETDNTEEIKQASREKYCHKDQANEPAPEPEQAQAEEKEAPSPEAQTQEQPDQIDSEQAEIEIDFFDKE